MPGSELFCWKCGGSLESLQSMIRRQDECPSCGADLHVCKSCEFHDPRVSRECREPVADEVRDKERANFCGYFAPRRGAPQRGSVDDGAVRQAAAALFGLDEPIGGSPSQAEDARREAKRLFGLDDDSGEG